MTIILCLIFECQYCSIIPQINTYSLDLLDPSSYPSAFAIPFITSTNIMAPSSDPPTRTSTPRSFQSQTASAEDLLKSQTVGLVHLSDFRKRRAEVLEQKEREAQDKSLGRFKSGRSGTATPTTGEEGSDG